MTDSSTRTTGRARVQIFIPTFNRADRLEKAILSVLGQSWPDVEVVVLDNHSTDHTVEIMSRLCAQHARVRHVRHPTNIGMLANFNAIPAMVSGDFFAMLTDDDIYEPDFVTAAIGCFDAYPDVAMVACDAPTRHHGEITGRQLDYWKEGRYPPGAGVLKCLLGHYPIITNCLFRADIRADFRFEPDLGNTGDGYILTVVTANHAVAVSRYVSGYWNNDGTNASSLQGFDAVLISRIAIAEYALYRRLAVAGRFARRWLVIAWFKRGLSVLVAADRLGFAELRAEASLDAVFGPVSRACLGVLARTHAIRLFPWILSRIRRRARARTGRASNHRAR